MDDDLPFYVAFSYCLGIGPMTFQKLLVHFTSAQAAYTASQKELRGVLGNKTVEHFLSFRSTCKPEKIVSEIRAKDINILPFGSEQYPSRLATISDPPICLFVKGTGPFRWDEHAIGVVGARRPSQYGRQITRLFVNDLVSAGVTIISGLALGIDAAAHIAALEQKRKTIAVIGCGVDIVYPYENKHLYDSILHSDGYIISEFPPGQTVHPGLFVARNRIISALSEGVVVIEGTNKSGALITARYAAEQGREVFAPPVPLTSHLSEAPSILLREGATYVTSGNDILSSIGLEKGSKPFIEQREQLTSEEERMCLLLQEKPYSSDEIEELLSMKMTYVLQFLTDLEMKGIVVRNEEGKYGLR